MNYGIRIKDSPIIRKEDTIKSLFPKESKKRPWINDYRIINSSDIAAIKPIWVAKFEEVTL